MPEKKRPRKPEPQLTEEDLLWLIGSPTQETEFAKILPMPVPTPRVWWRRLPDDPRRRIPVFRWDGEYPTPRRKLTERRHTKPRRVDALSQRAVLARAIDTPEGKRALCPYCKQLWELGGFNLHTIHCRKRRGRPPKEPAPESRRSMRRCPFCGLVRPSRGFAYRARHCAAKDGAPPKQKIKPSPKVKQPKPPKVRKPRPPPKTVLCPRCGEERKENGLRWHLYWCGRLDQNCPHCRATVSAPACLVSTPPMSFDPGASHRQLQAPPPRSPKRWEYRLAAPVGRVGHQRTAVA